MTEPTDAELIAELEAAGVVFMAFRGGLSGTKELWTTSGSQDAKKIAAGMRAAIAKWGQPAGAGEPVAWVDEFELSQIGHNGFEPTVSREPVSEHDLPLCLATPQPTHAQAGAVPMTDEQVERAAKKIAECMDYPWGHMPTIGREEMRIHARAVLEAAHGIKGGQHGADTRSD